MVLWNFQDARVSESMQGGDVFLRDTCYAIFWELFSMKRDFLMMEYFVLLVSLLVDAILKCSWALLKNSEILYLFLASVDVLTLSGRSCSNCVLKETAQFFTCRAWLTRNPLPSSPAEICKERAAVIVLVTIIHLLTTYIRSILEWANRK